jgi:putative OPT family oligopeptide transporter
MAAPAVPTTPPSVEPHAPAPQEPYVPASANLPEITIRSLILSLILAVVLAAANAYLGLFAGLTVSASIPAAVMSMAILRFFKNSSILENNIVQTAAASGQSVAAGVIFTVPALLILGAWTEFQYWPVTMIAGLGGVLGVLFTIPLRRAYIVESPLKFPEGAATAEVLKVGDQGGAGISYLAWSGLVGALFKLGDTGLKLWTSTFEVARYAGGTIAYFGTNLSPALVGVGYIVGLNIALVIFLGGALNWFVAIPIAAALQGISLDTDPAAAAGALWSRQTRYIGVGGMVLGGMWALLKVRGSIVGGIRSGVEAYRSGQAGGADTRLRTERDIPMPWIGGAIAFCTIPLFFVFQYATQNAGVAAFMTVVMLLAGFLFSAVAGYMAGLVGSSNNPISGVTIATILTAALLLVLLLGQDSAIGPAAAVLIGAVVACAGAIAGDNLQDLKAGRIVGATPYKQQIMQILGAVVAAFVMAPVLTLLLEAYGIGGAPTAQHPNPLSAPQATLMAAVAGGVFGDGLPWNMVAIGVALAAVVIAIDVQLERRGSDFRMPVLAVAVGIYLPLELSVPIVIGGLIAHAGERAFAGRGEAARQAGERNGLLFAAGLITGEALMGIVLAFPIVLTGNADSLAFFGRQNVAWPGLVLLGVVTFALYRAVTAPARARGA